MNFTINITPAMQEKLDLEQRALKRLKAKVEAEKA